MQLATNPTPSPWGGGSIHRLAEHVHAARMIASSVWIASDIPKIRDEMIDRLVKAIVEANELAKEAPTKPEKGGGGVAPKAHWYRLFGYLIQVLDSLCSNVEISEVNERLLKIEKALRVAKARPPQAR
jgi:hypothetical protein